ncbi:hypothetical protein [Enhygromyxa salina]|uniref:hypothetical protein n=1 Tax=Enhygromyxa salina TaxID=215803 RepID=UPI0011BABFC5|nr:hypothetical protein [Enhygromyxa salina]
MPYKDLGSGAVTVFSNTHGHQTIVVDHDGGVTEIETGVQAKLFLDPMSEICVTEDILLARQWSTDSDVFSSLTSSFQPGYHATFGALFDLLEINSQMADFSRDLEFGPAADDSWLRSEFGEFWIQCSYPLMIPIAHRMAIRAAKNWGVVP